jgi:hypothetical protein
VGRRDNLSVARAIYRAGHPNMQAAQISCAMVLAFRPELVDRGHAVSASISEPNDTAESTGDHGV